MPRITRAAQPAAQQNTVTLPGSAANQSGALSLSSELAGIGRQIQNSDPGLASF